MEGGRTTAGSSPRKKRKSAATSKAGVTRSSQAPASPAQWAGSFDQERLLELCHVVFRSASEGVIVVDDGGLIRLANDKVEELFGYPRDELIGSPVDMLVPERLRKVHLGHRKQYWAAPRSRPMGQGMDLVARRKDGTEFPVEIGLNLVETDEANLVVGLISDVTVRRQMEEALRAQMRQIEQILDTTMDGHILADTNGTLLNVNPAYCDMVGYSREELLEMNIRELEVALAPEDVERRIEQLVELGKDRFETKHRCKGGGTVDLDVSIVIMQPEETPLVAAFVRDITERKRAEEALRASESVLRGTMESAADGVLVLDTEWRIMYVNRRFADMWSLPDGLLETRDASKIIPIVLDQLKDPDAFQTRIRGAFSADEVTFDITSLKDGRVFEQYSVPLLIGSEVAGRVVRSRDITARTRAEEALEAARDELEGRVESQIVQANPYGLTFREFTVLNLVAAGKPDKKIARDLGISLMTVHKHVGAILGKMNASSRTDAAARALREGLIE